MGDRGGNRIDQDLLDAVHAAIERDRARRQQLTGVADLEERYRSLTERERDIMALVVVGRLNKLIAAELGLAEVTVRPTAARSCTRWERSPCPSSCAWPIGSAVLARRTDLAGPLDPPEIAPFRRAAAGYSGLKHDAAVDPALLHLREDVVDALQRSVA